MATHYTTFSTIFPAYHPKAGQPTHFIEKIWSGLLNINHHWYQQFLPGHNDEDMAQALELRNKVLRFTPKYHTIREDQRFQVGDSIIPWHWSGKPYRSKWVKPFDDGNLAIPIERVWDIDKVGDMFIFDGHVINRDDIMKTIAMNDGLELEDFINWFAPAGLHERWKGQIICWNPAIRYLDSDPKPIEVAAPNPNRKIIKMDNYDLK